MHNLHASLHEEIHTCPIVILAPRRVGIKDVIALAGRCEGVNAIVELGVKMPNALFFGEPVDSPDDPLIEVKYCHSCRAVLDDSALLQIGHADADRISIADESEPLVLGLL